MSISDLPSPARRRFLMLACSLVIAAGAAAQEPASLASLRREFVAPPATARPGCYWWWLDGLVNKPAITRDLEEFAAKGIGEVLLVNSANLRASPDFGGGVKFLSPEWRELYRHALREANRLGIEVGVNLCGGWCMGGPWIPPEHAGRWFLQSRLVVEGPRQFSEPLPLPGHRDGYDHVFNPPGFKDYIDLPLEKLDYRDTAVVAFPTPDNESATKFSGARAKLLPAKTNRRDASNFTRARDVMGPTLEAWQDAPSDQPIAPEKIVDLTAKLTPDGRLEWDVPPGRWTIVRTGHRMTGSRVMIPPPETDGLSIGWLSPAGVELQFKHLGELLLADAAAAGVKLKYFCDDSFEDGFPNWTEQILERFRHYRGYDPTPYLPVLSGYIVGSAERSDRFLHDYRKTVADCMADGHYRRFAELTHERGLLVQNEAAGPSRSGTMCMDGLKNLGRSDLPQGEFWLGLRHDEEGGLDPKLGYGVSRLEDGQNKVTKMVASAAHIYGRPLASAESFTSNRHWLDSPATLKSPADRAFCEGINRFMIHCSTLAREEDGKPGYEYYAGTHFNPNVTWWPQVGPFLTYLARCQHLLRQGRFVADVLYYNGDGAPNLVGPKHVDPALGRGFDYDVCNAEVLLERVTVRDGRIVLPDGMSYRLLVLPDDARMPVEIAAKIRALVAAGATVVGPRPERDPGLRNFPACDAEVRRLAAEVWGGCDGRAVKAHAFGRGRVFWGETLRDILRADGVGPDFEPAPAEGGTLDFIHRRTDEADIYFVANLQPRAVALDCAFRVRGGAPEIWDPVTGEARAVRSFRVTDTQTILPLEFAAHQSFFVVFPKSPVPRVTVPETRGGLRANFPAFTPAAELTGAWTVKFDPRWGGPAETTFAQLDDWTKRPEFGIRHYSGTATYLKRFDVPAGANGRLFLDLGVVKNIASVRLNGRNLGVVWTAPWRVEVTDVLRPTGNELEIDVTNLWPNRLLGDRGLPPTERLTRTNIQLAPDARLLPSGLLGPVRLLHSSL
ncbi:glycosyl hydrolase [Oleiharenicola sp. Vm1]|uniref:glycosyl hydrolase n=1 Tax=Oleiharenicola sp. Vm1 TaxID=3398393 RepID=UPI0039F46D73